MAGILVVFPKCHFLKVMLTTPMAAALAAEAMEEVTEMRKPWYGFWLIPKIRPEVHGCCVTAKVSNTSGDYEGIHANWDSLSLRATPQVFPIDESRQARNTGKIIPFPVVG